MWCFHVCGVSVAGHIWGLFRATVRDVDALPHPTLLPPASEGWGKVIFSLCVSVHTLMGGGVPHLRSGWVGTPSQVWLGGYPIPGLAGGYPISGLAGGVPHLRSGWGELPHLRSGGYPISGLGRGGTPSQVWVGGVPHLRLGGTQGTPLPRPDPHYTEQHSEYSLRGGRCASCVHAGGLSCCKIVLLRSIVLNKYLRDRNVSWSGPSCGQVKATPILTVNPFLGPILQFRLIWFEVKYLIYYSTLPCFAVNHHSQIRNTRHLNISLEIFSYLDHFDVFWSLIELLNRDSYVFKIKCQ